MATKFTVTQHIKVYADIKGNYDYVDAKNRFVVHNYDDLQNLLMTLIDFSDDKLSFDVEKEEVSE